MRETSGQRTLDEMIIASELYVKKLLAEYEKYMLGDRAEMMLPGQMEQVEQVPEEPGAEVMNGEQNIYGQT